MSGKVVSLGDWRPHAEGTAVCLDCKHEWVAVAPSETIWLECPGCGLVRGRFKYPHSRGDTTWECGCGNDLFVITPDGVFCPNCGAWQTGWEK